MFGGHGLTGLAGPLLRVFCQEGTPMTTGKRKDMQCAVATLPSMAGFRGQTVDREDRCLV